MRPDIVDRHDVGMVQLGEDSGFVEKGLDILGVGDPLRVGHLDGDRAIEVIVVSKIDPSESALTQRPEPHNDRSSRGARPAGYPNSQGEVPRARLGSSTPSHPECHPNARWEVVDLSL